MLVIDNEEHHIKMLNKADATNSRESLDEQFKYLDNYGTDPSKVRISLGYDFAGYSVLWDRLDTEDTWVSWMHGGLIHHSDTNLWSVHT